MEYEQKPNNGDLTFFLSRQTAMRLSKFWLNVFIVNTLFKVLLPLNSMDEKNFEKKLPLSLDKLKNVSINLWHQTLIHQ